MTAYKKDDPARFDATAMGVVNQLTVELLGYREPEDDDEPGGSRGWGLEYEWLAKQEYAQRTMSEITEAKFRAAPNMVFVGGTMDGLVGQKGGVEIKCPYNALNHFAREAQIKAYRWQLQGYMWIYELEWIDFISFDPRFPEPLQLIVERIERNMADIETLFYRCQAAHTLAKINAEKLQAKHTWRSPYINLLNEPF